MKKLSEFVYVPREWRRLALIISAAIVCPGCGSSIEELPKTFPATGQLVNKAGKPVSPGMIEFNLATDEKIQAIGKLEPDGTFSLRTAIGKEVLPGAVEGAHKVTFLPGTQSQQPAYFKEKYTVGSGTNHFKLIYPY